MMSSPKLLFIVPKEAASPLPVIDHLTRKVCAAFRQARVSDYAYGGVHLCICGANSSSSDYWLPNGDLTNSLCVHYVAYHRSEVSGQEVARIEAFTFGEVEPSLQELKVPRPIQVASSAQEAASLSEPVTELDLQIAALTQQKEAAVGERDFERASRLREQVANLRRKKLEGPA